MSVAVPLDLFLTKNCLNIPRNKLLPSALGMTVLPDSGLSWISYYIIYALSTPW